MQMHLQYGFFIDRSSPLWLLLSMMVNNCGELFSLLPTHFLAGDQVANELEVPAECGSILYIPRS